MTTTVLAKHDPYEDGHLGRIVDEMRLCGAPTIRVVRFDGDHWVALEGSHRLAAAAYLGLAPKLVELASDIERPAPHWRAVLRRLPRFRFDGAMLLELEQIFGPRPSEAAIQTKRSPALPTIGVARGT